MTDQQKPQSSENLPNSFSSSSDSRLPPETGNRSTNDSGQKVRYPNPPEPSYTNTNYSGKSNRFPNPPDATNPDPATLREQWRFAIKQYSRWYSHAWGTAILAGLSFFALGWIIKGSNPLPSFKGDSSAPPDGDGDGDGAADRDNAK